MPVPPDVCRPTELEQEVSQTLSSEVLEVLFLPKSPVTSQSSDKCTDLVSLASFSSHFYTENTLPISKAHFLHDRVNSPFCVWVLYLRAQRVELLNAAVLGPTLLPAAQTEAPAPTSLAWTDPLPVSTAPAWTTSPPLHDAVWRHLDRLVPPAAGCLSQVQVAQGSAVSTGGCTLRGRALHISSATASSSEREGGNSKLTRKYGPICALLTYGSN